VTVIMPKSFSAACLVVPWHKTCVFPQPLKSVSLKQPVKPVSLKLIHYTSIGHIPMEKGPSA
jgi:hypothetical protein